MTRTEPHLSTSVDGLAALREHYLHHLIYAEEGCWRCRRSHERAMESFQPREPYLWTWQEKLTQALVLGLLILVTRRRSR